MNKTQLKTKVKNLEAQYERERSDLKNWWITNKDYRWSGANRTRYRRYVAMQLPQLTYTRKSIKYWRERLDAKR